MKTFKLSSKPKKTLKELKEIGEVTIPAIKKDQGIYNLAIEEIEDVRDFEATYETTTYNEIVAALQAGLNVVMLHSTYGQHYYAKNVYWDQSKNVVTFTEFANNRMYVFSVNNANTWSFEFKPLVEEATKDGKSYVRKNGSWVEVETPEIPTKTSQLENDSSFTNKEYVDGLVGDVESLLAAL